MYGPWGSGKTTVLNFIEEYLAEKHPKEIVVVTYNPWVYRDDEEMLASFFKLVADRLEVSLESFGAKAGGVLKRFGGLFRLAPVVGGVAGESARVVGDLLTNRDLEDLKSEFARALEEAGARVLVQVDDIDRLALNQVLSIFRLVKLLADFDRTLYVLAFDREVVVTALESEAGGDLPIGPRYLDKIIQVPLHLPEPEPQVMLDQLLVDLNRVLHEHGLIGALDADDLDRLGGSIADMSAV